MHEFVAWAQRLAQRSRKEVVLTAFNTGFDFALLRLALHESGAENPFGHGGFCSQSYAMAAITDHDWSKATIGELAKMFGTVPELTHHALQDAKDQQQLHFALAGYVASLG